MVNYKHLFIATFSSMCVSRVFDIFIDTLFPKITKEHRKKYEAMIILVIFVIVLRFFDSK